MSGQAKPRRLGVSQALEGTLRIGGGGAVTVTTCVPIMNVRAYVCGSCP